MTSNTVSAGVALVCACFSAGVVDAATSVSFPDRPVRILVPTGPGSGTDILARTIGSRLAETWGQSVVIDNRPGAAAIIGTELAAKSPTDGHTLVIGFSGTLAVNPVLYRKLPYDPIRDFAPISLIASIPAVLAVHPSVPAASVKELIALAKAKPNTLNFGSAGAGTIGHMAAELFSVMSGVKMTHVPYKSSGQAMTDLISGQIQVMFHSAPTVLPHAEASRVRGIAVTSKKRSSAAPQLPTIAEAGLPGYEMDLWFGVLAPAGTREEIIAIINKEVVRIMRSPEIEAQFRRQGIEPLSSTPQEFSQHIRQEIARYTKLVKSAGITAN